MTSRGYEYSEPNSTLVYVTTPALSLRVREHSTNILLFTAEPNENTVTEPRLDG